MKLDNKYFPAFMGVVALLMVISIVYSSLQYKETQKERFEEAIIESDSLLIKPLRLLDKSKLITLSELNGSDVVLVFWSSWSEKSDFMLQEIYTLQSELKNFKVVSALVLDAEESIEFENLNQNFIHVDGASFYNDLKVPGIPSYVVLNDKGEFLKAHVGYQENAGYSLLKNILDGK